MMKFFLIIMFCVCSNAVINAVELGEKYTTLIFPENVNLGMTCNMIQTQRPDAKKIKGVIRSQNTNVVVLAELKVDAVPLVCYQYHFIDNHLRAITKSIGHGANRDEQMVKRLHEAISKDLKKQADEKILRLNTELEQIPVELWKDEKNGKCVYFVDTSNDTSVIVFDPKYFVKKDFFITADEMQQVIPAVESVHKAIESSKKQKNKKANQE
ncbi:MAG: hypothetical protein PHO37_02870 [Kiritimatiellae bacterium]|nr:hypothetical protein [Kiritimatiellia bacterium]